MDSACSRLHRLQGPPHHSRAHAHFPSGASLSWASSSKRMGVLQRPKIHTGTSMQKVASGKRCLIRYTCTATRCCGIIRCLGKSLPTSFWWTCTNGCGGGVDDGRVAASGDGGGRS